MAPAMAKIRLKLGLTAKTFLAIFTACLLVLAVNGIASRVAFQTGFLDYLNDQGDLRMQRLHLLVVFIDVGQLVHARIRLFRASRRRVQRAVQL